MSEELSQEMNLVEMPVEGVAAYWLSLKKIMGAKVVPKTLEDEAQNTAEPFIRGMLDLCISGLDDATARHAALRRRDTVLHDMRLKLGLMRDALLSIAVGENPRMVLMRMFARLPLPVITEENVTKMALDMVRLAEANKDGYVVTVSTKLTREELVVKLMFYVLWARREGKAAIEVFGQNGRCRYFNQGLVMTADGHDRSFIKTCLDTAAEEILDDAGQKMGLTLDMALALRSKTSYEDMFRIAQAYIP